MSAKTREVNIENFESIVLHSDLPVLVDFWAEWCGPCRAIAPTVDRLSERFDGRATIGKIDVDTNSTLASKYGVQSIPTLILFAGGEQVERFVGIRSEEELASAIESALPAKQA